MEGPPGDRGVNFRTLADLFAVIEERRVESAYSVTISVLEVNLYLNPEGLDAQAGPCQQRFCCI